MQPWLWVWLLATPIILALISLGGTGRSSTGTAARTNHDLRTTRPGEPVGPSTV